MNKDISYNHCLKCETLDVNGDNNTSFFLIRNLYIDEIEILEYCYKKQKDNLCSDVIPIVNKTHIMSMYQYCIRKYDSIGDNSKYFNVYERYNNEKYDTYINLELMSIRQNYIFFIIEQLLKILEYCLGYKINIDELYVYEIEEKYNIERIIKILQQVNNDVTINIIKFLNYCFYENYEHDLFLVCNEINEELGVNGHLKKNMTVHYIPKIKNIDYENYALGY